LRRRFNMKTKKNMMMIAMAAILIGTVSLAFGFGGGGRSEDPLGDLDAHPQGPAVIGNVAASLVEVIPPMGDPYWNIEYTITGTCKGTAITPEQKDFPAPTDINDMNFNTIDAGGIESFVYLDGYPDECDTAKTGDDLIVIKAKNVMHMTINGTSMLTAEIVALSVVYR
jgi:hypothetical protein